MVAKLIRLSPQQLAKIESLVEGGEYSSVEQFVDISVNNQLILELETNGVRLAERTSPDGVEIPAAVPAVNHQPPRLADSVPASKDPLFGQYYRFLPLKFALRHLAAAGGTIRIAEDADRIARAAAGFAATLPERNDGLNLRTGFPTVHRDAAKSLSRYVDQYIGRFRSDGDLGGLGADMGFIAGVSRDEGEIALTPAGFEFGSFENPVMDERGDSALSESEDQYIVSWVSRHMPGEAKNWECVLQGIAAGHDGPGSLSTYLGQEYPRAFPRISWTASKVGLTRSGVTSRLSELRVLRSEKRGNNVVFSIDGENWTRLREEEEASLSAGRDQ